jgi:DNA recombination protein RmuC
MIIYILIATVICLTVGTFILAYKAQKYYLELQANLNYITKLENELKEKNISYETIRDKLAGSEKENIIYHERLRELDHKVTEFENLKNSMLEHTKAAVFEVGNQLSNKLLEDHKREAEEAKKASEYNTTKVNEHLSKIINSVIELESKVKESSNTVDIIKTSLMSPTGAGSLAEITLENILKSSGLLPDLDFIMQYTINSEHDKNSKLRPDAIVFLPGNNIMVIDSKASKFLLEWPTDNNDYSENLKATMRSHLKDLTSKDYKQAVRSHLQKNMQDIGHISTLMFLPTEHALEKIQNFDREFLQKAWDAQIFPAGPVGIINILAHAKFHIFEQKKMQNYQNIIEEVRKTLVGISRLYDHTKKMGNAIYSAANHYDKMAASFNSNLLNRINNLKTLGLESNNNITSLERYQMISNANMIETDE